MKVTRLKKGIRIHLTDIQYEVLCQVCGNGFTDDPGDLGFFEPGELRAYDHVANNLGCFHEDRR